MIRGKSDFGRPDFEPLQHEKSSSSGTAEFVIATGMEGTVRYHFNRQDDYKLTTFNTNDRKETLKQWNLDECISVKKFSVIGATQLQHAPEIISDFFSNPEVLADLDIAGSCVGTPSISFIELSTSVRSMEFFSRVQNDEVVSSTGTIRGCYDEVFDGITVGDKLREMLVNPDSENAHLFSNEEKNELAFQLFKLLAVGGSLCQPEHTVKKYFEVTKDLYKELLVLYKSAKTGEIEVGTRAFQINSIAGLQLFPVEGSPHNTLLVTVNSLDKSIVVVKKEYKPFW